MAAIVYMGPKSQDLLNASIEHDVSILGLRDIETINPTEVVFVLVNADKKKDELSTELLEQIERSKWPLIYVPTKQGLSVLPSTVWIPVFVIDPAEEILYDDIVRGVVAIHEKRELLEAGVYPWDAVSELSIAS